MATLFVKTRCPACDAVKRELSKARVSVTLRNIDTDPSAYDTVMSLGARVVPVLVGDDGAVYVNTAECLRGLGIR